MTHAKIEYRLKALDEFVCIGADCPANCCCDTWRIEVEPDIRQRWQTLLDASERDRLVGVLTEQTVQDKALLLITRSTHGCCPLLTPEHQCSLQQKHGESLMPTVCRTYPRSQSDTPIHHLATASLSCPEIARLVMFESPDGPVFQKSVSGQFSTSNDADHIRYTLTEMLDRVMAERKYSVATRAYYLSDFIVRLSRLSIQGQLNTQTLNRATSNAKGDLYRVGVDIKERRLHSDPAVAGSYWHTLYRIGRNLDLLPAVDASSPLARELPTTFPDRQHLYKDVHAEVIRLRNSANAALRSYEAHFNRYLHGTLMYHGFPWNPAVDNYIASLMRAMIPFSLARLSLFLTAARQGGLTDDDVLKATYRIERRISHSQQVLAILNANPELLELDRYHTTFVDL